MKPWPTVLAIDLSVCCILSACIILSGCAPIPKRIAPALRGPQPTNALVTPAADPTGMIVWKQTVLNSPPPPQYLNSQSNQRCGGFLGTLFSEWKNVDNRKNASKLQFFHGTLAASQFAGSDFGGTHRYRDWNMLLVVDQSYEVFLAPANFFSLGGWDDDALAQDLFVANPNLDPLIELEWDSGFFAPEMAPSLGDETFAVGRWDFDCGHESTSKSSEKLIGFRAEMHAPGIVISSHVLQSDPSGVHAQFKVFAGSRSGPLNSPPFLVFLPKFWSSYKNRLGGQDYSANLRALGDGWKIASCSIKDGSPAGGKPHRFKAQVESDDGGKSLTLTIPAHTFGSGAKIESSTMIDVSWVPADSSPGGGITKCE